MTKNMIVEYAKYYSGKIDVDEFLNNKTGFREEWENWKKEDGYTDNDIHEFISEKIYEWGPPEDMFGISDFRLDDWEVRVEDY